MVTTHEEYVSTSSPNKEKESQKSINIEYSHDIFEEQDDPNEHRGYEEDQPYNVQIKEESLHEEYHFDDDQVYEEHMDEEENQVSIKEEELRNDEVMKTCLDGENNQFFFLSR
jgi:hypothetical protein